MSPILTIVTDVEHDGFRSMRGLLGADDPRLIRLGEDAQIEIGALQGGMASGAPSVALCIQLPDGRVVLAETSMALLLTAADTLAELYGDPRR
jgi:hypothetical protein